MGTVTAAPQVSWLVSMSANPNKSESMSFDRRSFLKSASAAGIALSAAPFVHAASRDKKYRTALIGSGWWGMNLLKGAMAAGNVKVVALCDVDSDTLELAAETVTDLSGDEPKTYKDFRELFEEFGISGDKDILHILH